MPIKPLQREAPPVLIGGGRDVGYNVVAAPRLLILADDLTGACDSAIVFAQHGIQAQAVLDGYNVADPHVEVVARSTETRDLDPEEATRRLLQASREVSPDTEIFKKIDSVFRGNTYVEILAAVECMPHDLVIIAPASPELGRRSMNGVVISTDITGEARIPVLQELRAHGLKVRHLALARDAKALLGELEDCLRNREHVVYCDAADSADLAVVVAAARQLQHRILWIGSSGLAHALAVHVQERRLGVTALPVLGAVVLFVGSDHPVTEAQLAYLRETKSVLEKSVCESESAAAEDAQVLLLRVPRGRATEEDIRRWAFSLPAQRIGCLFMSGGDTAALVCSALGIKAISLVEEFAPGLPAGIAVGGPYASTPVILKSGGFGDRDILCRIVGKFLISKDAC